MARRNESIPDQIIRLYKEGNSMDSIAKTMGIPKDNVPKILEKHMPDYATFIQPKNGQTDKPVPEKPQKGRFDFFKKKKDNSVPAVENKPVEEPKKQQPIPAPKPFKPSINLTMDNNGFVDNTVRGIASMLQNGRDVNDIASFFNRDPDDVYAVRERMNEHFQRVNSSDNNGSQQPSDNGNTANTGLHGARGNVYTSGLEGMQGIKNPTNVQPTPNVDSYLQQNAKAAQNIEPEVTDEMPSIDPISIDELDEKLEKKEEESSETIPEIEPVFAPTEKAADEEKSETAQVNSDDDEEIDFNIDDEEGSIMTPMEKMKKFAEQQIELNNQKISELENQKKEIADKENTAKARLSEIESKKVEIGAKLADFVKQENDLKEQLAAIQNSIAEARNESASINEEKVKIDAEVAEIGSSVADVDAQIAEISKENEEFKSYFK